MNFRDSTRARPRISCVISIGLVSLGLAPAVSLAQALHPSLATVILLEDEAIRLAGPSHVKVVEKDGKTALEGASSVVEASQALVAWHLDHGQLDQAMKVVEAGLKQESKDQSLLSFAAAICLRRGDPAKALGYVGEKPKSGDTELIYYIRGRALEALRRPDDAAAALAHALRLAPGNAQYALSSGNVLYELGRWDEAIEAFQTASAPDRGAFAAKCNLGIALVQAGRIEEAAKLYRAALEPLRSTSPDAPTRTSIARAFANLGAILMRMQSWDEAASAYETAVRLDDKAPDAAYNHAYLLYRGGEREKSYEEYGRALEVDPALPLAHLHLAEIDLRRGDAARAAEGLERGSAHFDETLAHDAFVLKGQAYRALGDLDRAASAYRSAFERAPEDLPVLASLAALLRARGELSEARKLLEGADERFAGEATLLLELAALARAEGKHSEEEALYRQVLTQEGEGDSTWVIQLNLALILLRRGEMAEARQRLEPLVERLGALPENDADSPLSREAASVLATAYGMLVAHEGSIQEGRDRIAEVTRRADRYPPALEALAVLAALEGDLETSRARLTELVSELQDDSAAMARGNLGLVLWLGGKNTEAREHLEAAAGKFPEWLSVRVALARVELQTGRFASAVDEATASQKLCQDEAAESRVGPGLPSSWLQFTLGGGASRAEGALCKQVDRDLASALIGAAMSALSRTNAEPNARKNVDAWLRLAFSLSLTPVDKARAFFARGTMSLIEGADEKARHDLTQALSGNLDPPLRSLAENNLGVAFYRLGQIAEAERHFAAARAGTGGSAAATLNMGITLDERNENGEALRLYQEYVASAAGVPRRAEVQSWIEDLKKVYR
jgi:tetratricopeptide (TPR) repeat protein